MMLSTLTNQGIEQSALMTYGAKPSVSEPRSSLSTEYKSDRNLRQPNGTTSAFSEPNGTNSNQNQGLNQNQIKESIALISNRQRPNFEQKEGAKIR
ncbi:hypothetical protein LIER_13525 [Lithospermum erythrorhizon]|uniref:Uncharacterized protein n=1 Tax=Lithospermum erythrorhizon TaxID=34254 RepID=A0AAV3PXY6_LITER